MPTAMSYWLHICEIFAKKLEYYLLIGNNFCIERFSACYVYPGSSSRLNIKTGQLLSFVFTFKSQKYLFYYYTDLTLFATLQEYQSFCDIFTILLAMWQKNKKFQHFESAPNGMVTALCVTPWYWKESFYNLIPRI